jgi:hypothetical protein
MRRFVAGLVGVASLAAIILGGAASVTARADELAAVRAATARFHDFDKADESGLGAMGQHYVNGDLADDAYLDPAAPEALMYEPTPGGGERLVGVEWVVLQSVWEAAGHAEPPVLFGRTLTLVPEPNRFGIPAFYEIHGWVWKPNPSGVHSDWNPRVSCRGQGD